MGMVAYDIDNYVEKSREEIEKRQQIEIVRKEKRLAKARNIASAKISAKAVIVSAILISMLFAGIYCRVQISEINARSAKVKSAIAVAESDNVRLNMELDSKASIYSIYEYASDVLGMHKISENQINYLDLSAFDESVLVKAE